MAKIDGKYKQVWTEDLLNKINQEDNITKRHRLITQYINQRCKQIEKIIANFDDDVDLEMVVEQLWEDLHLAEKQLLHTIERVDFYARCYNLNDDKTK